VRVIHVAPTGFGTGGLFGGGERYPLELARALAERVDCELVTFGREQGYRRDGPLGIRVLRPLGYIGGHPARAIVPALPRVIRDADIVHVHHMRSPPSVLAALAARARGIPTVVTDHGYQGTELGGLVPRLFDRFLTVSRYSAAELRAPSRRTRVIYGGARLADQVEPARPRSGVLFVGRLTPHKGIDVLIRALPPGARLTIVGTGGHDPDPPERDYPQLLRDLAEARDVEFVGPVDDDDLADRYRRAAVVVVPSVERTWYGREIAVSELLGLVAIEAMASGTPVVASRVGGLPEVVQDGVTGYLVPPGDVAALHGRLTAILRDPELAGRLGANGRALARAELTWDRCAERCLEAYRELLDGRRR
jgi:glycosyltransferase involved in cell wall biosynthesis